MKTAYLFITAINIALLGSSAFSAWAVAWSAYQKQYRWFAVGFATFGLTFLVMALRRITALNLLITRINPLSTAEQFDQVGLPLIVSVGIFSGVVCLGRAYVGIAGERNENMQVISVLLFGMIAVALLTILSSFYFLLALSNA